MWLLLHLLCLVLHVSCMDLHLTTSDEGYMTVIQGFAARLECMLNTCVRHAATVIWYKDDVAIFNATKFLDNSGIDPSTLLLQHKIEFDRSKDCSGTCTDLNLCPDGSHCVDNKCCPCASEEFTLVLKNLTFDDAGRYRCQVSNQPQQLEFQLEVLESGLKGGFHENISYDYSECCAEKGISELCKAMCKPKDMHIYHFDPTSCKTDDYKNFLSCATEGGNRSHVQCCKTQLVPSFCYDFCSGNFQMLRKSHRLCLYYLPEIFECYNRAYLPYPEHPVDLIVNAVGSDELRVCWRPPQSQSSNKHLDIVYYTVYFKQIPSFPFLGGDDGIPLLSGDYEESIPNGGGEEEIVDANPGGPVTVKLRRKRQTWLFVTHDSTTNDSTVREFKFDQVNTTKTCVTLSDLRPATRYIVYVTASNEFGTSVPSSRALAATNAIVIPSNASLPQIEPHLECCSSNGASPYCASKMCNVRMVPNALETIAISTSCRLEWSKVSPCLADGRNHTDCCIRKGVQHDCLKICGGVPEPLTMHSLLCLNLDIAAIYQCLRQGYETRPSAPQNVTVTGVTDSSAQIEWDDPSANAHLVESFSLYIRKDNRDSETKIVRNVSSPHIEYDLDVDSEYTIYLKSHSEAGDSLMSTAQVFFTQPFESPVCPHGQPLFHPNGQRYHCGANIRECPPMYTCTILGSSESDTYCCPKSPKEKSSVYTCCKSRGVSTSCLNQCSYNISLTQECESFGDIWVQCSSDGRDFSKCCSEYEIPEECMPACRHPFVLGKDCLKHASLLTKCYSSLYFNIPKAVINLEVVYRNTTTVLLSWDALVDNVDVYQVEILKQGSVFKQINTTTNSARFDNLEPSTNYSARVISFNEKNSSPPSLQIIFETLADNEPGDRPEPPSNLHVAWNYGRRVNITWNWDAKRVNGEVIDGKAVFFVYYVPASRSSAWISANTSDKWYVMNDLILDSLYEVYILASDGTSDSRTSSVVTILASPDELSLPEPIIELSPDNSDHTYPAGQIIGVKCFVKSHRPLNLDLTVGDSLIHNDPPKMSIETLYKVDEKQNQITCTVMDSTGRQNRAQAHIFVEFGPEVSLPIDKVHAYDDLAAQIHCTVRAFPEPQVQWLYKQTWNSVPLQRLSDQVLLKRLGANKYDFILFIQNVTNRNGIYRCEAKGKGDLRISKDVELHVAKAALPLTPRFVLQCCVDAKISAECLEACSVKPERVDGCSQYSKDLINCANDGRDHQRCCADSGIPPQCLGLCSNTTVKDYSLCGTYATKAVACMIRGHERAPSVPGPIHYENLSHKSVKVHWSDPDLDTYKVYAVYYRPENSNDDFTMKKTSDNEIVIDNLEPNKNYDIALVAANAVGHSPFVEARILNSFQAYTENRPKLFVPLFLIFLILLVAAMGVLYASRIINIPYALRHWRRSHPFSDRDPTVAFENPGYGNEVQIRGLQHDDAPPNMDWQSAQLEVAADTTREPNTGMRYAKLNS